MYFLGQECSAVQFFGFLYPEAEVRVRVDQPLGEAGCELLLRGAKAAAKYELVGLTLLKVVDALLVF